MTRREKIAISQDFVDHCIETICEFGAVRSSSFSRFIEKKSGLSPELASKIVDKLIFRKELFLGQYARTSVIKADAELKPDPKALDAFEAYLYILENETGDLEPYVNKAAFPLDFTICADKEDESLIYNLFIYDVKNLDQKLGIYERKFKDHSKHVILIVFPPGVNIEKAEIPELNGRYRYAVVKKSSDGTRVICRMTEIQGDKA